MIDLNALADLGFIVIGALAYWELRALRMLLKDRTGSIWKPQVTYHTHSPKTHPGQSEKPQVRMKTGPKNPMIYPMTDEQLAEREAVLEKNAKGKDFGF